MFVVSKKRETLMGVFAGIALITSVYWVMWALRMLGSWFLLPEEGETVVSPTSVVGLFTSPILEMVWPTWILWLLPAVVLLDMIVYNVYCNYTTRTYVLKRINKRIEKIPALQNVKGVASYTARGHFGPETGSITRRSATEFDFVYSVTNAFGAKPLMVYVIDVTESSFSSTEGASLDVMSLFSEALRLAKRHSKTREVSDPNPAIQ